MISNTIFQFPHSFFQLIIKPPFTSSSFLPTTLPISIEKKENTKMGHEDLCNTGLVLGLGCSPKLENGLIYNHHRPNASIKPDHSLFSSDQEPTLTLSLADDTYKESNKIGVSKAIQQSSSPHSTISSFSACIKRERDVVAGEDGEIEKVSCRVSDEDDDGSARKKLRLTKEQSALLEDSFKEHSTLNPKQKLALAKQLNLRPRQVEVWFQNRRARTKLKQTEVDCEFLKRCCEALTDENRRLQKELQELKAMNLASPFCMRFPAATVTMCPSCERIGVAGGGGDRAKNPFAIVPRSHQLYNPFTHSSAAC